MKIEQPSNTALMFASGYLLGSADRIKEQGTYPIIAKMLNDIGEWLQAVAASSEDIPKNVFFAQQLGRVEVLHDED